MTIGKVLSCFFLFLFHCLFKIFRKIYVRLFWKYLVNTFLINNFLIFLNNFRKNGKRSKIENWNGECVNVHVYICKQILSCHVSKTRRFSGFITIFFLHKHECMLLNICLFIFCTRENFIWCIMILSIINIIKNDESVDQL